MKHNRDLTLYRTPLSPAYWRSAWGEFRSLRSICLTAILIAICAMLDLLFIPIVDPNVMQIKFTFFAIALCAMVCGPVMAIPAGILIDTLGFLVGGGASGGYFFGYAISTACSCLIFALFFYRMKRITLWQIAGAKLAVNVFVNVLLGSVWRQVMVGKGYWYYVGLAAIKNAALLPLEVAILVVFLSRMVPLMRRASIIAPGVELRLSRRDAVATAVVGVVGIVAVAAYVIWKLG